MCLGIPMEIERVDGFSAQCRASGRVEAVDLALTGMLPVGTWVLVFLGAAREVLTAEDAAQISNALDGLASVMIGGDLGDAFADLESREPQLPPHLEAARVAGARTA